MDPGGKFQAAAIFICCLSSMLLLTSAFEVPLAVCPSENSVCNIGVENKTGVTFREQCKCSGGRQCPSSVHTEDGAVYFEEKWLVTCSPIDALPMCQPGQQSLIARSLGDGSGVDFQVLCVCPNAYTSDGAARSNGEVTADAFIYCAGNKNSTESTNDEEVQIPKNTDSPLSDESNIHLSTENNKRSRGNHAFYKRSESDRNLNSFYKRASSAFYKRDINNLNSFYKRDRNNLNTFYQRDRNDLNSFYKRDRNNLNTFYQRANLFKRAPFYKRKLLVAKRSIDDSFDDLTPGERSSSSNIKEFDEALSSNFGKRGRGLSLFYKRGPSLGLSSFYKRGGYGTSSFYRRTPVEGSDLSSLDGDESDDFPTLDEKPSEESAEKTSVENGASDNDLSSFYKRSLSSFYKREPWSNEEGTSSFDEKRALGEGNRAFYKRAGSSEENDTGKRARDPSSFYKRNGNNPNLSRFSKRNKSNNGDTHGISNFYKRAFGDVSNFYKRGISDTSNFYKRGISDTSNFYKRGLSGVSSFYKRGVGDDSRFHKRSLDNDSGFYKRGLGDDSRFYKRGLGDDSRFYKRGLGDDSRFYKRGLSDDSRFYKRGLGDDSRFYKRGLDDDSSFYKRGLGDVSSFYKRSRDNSKFYKRDVDGVSSFYKRGPTNGFAFYKREFDGVSNFYKRGFNDESNFYKRGLMDSSNFYKRNEKQNSFYKKNSELDPTFIMDDENGLEQVDDLKKRSALPNKNKRQAYGRNDRFYKRTLSDLTPFYKRSPSDDSMYSFYKRGPLDGSMYSFYKRSPYGNSISHFYKRVPSDHSFNSFYKRTNNMNAFYKREPGSNTMNFYKRLSPELNSFYKRSPSGLQSFYKRTLDKEIPLDDLENVMDQRRENYKQNTSSDHTNAGSIVDADDTISPNKLGDSTQQHTKQNLP